MSANLPCTAIDKVLTTGCKHSFTMYSPYFMFIYIALNIHNFISDPSIVGQGIHEAANHCTFSGILYRKSFRRLIVDSKRTVSIRVASGVTPVSSLVRARSMSRLQYLIMISG